MSLLELRQKIELKEARLAVVGLGYVGLPVACKFAQAGFDVLGIELRRDRVEMINFGFSPIDGHEPGLAELLTQVVESRKLRASTKYDELLSRDVILIAVETPVDEKNAPNYEALRSALCHLGPALKAGALVIVESTIAPGTMAELVLPLLSQSSGRIVNKDFFLAHCPERVMPGKLLANLQYVSRVVGGMTAATAETAVALYRHVVQAELDSSDCLTAELVKTTENAYRDVQIAFANEVALICEAAGGDVWAVRDLVNKSPHRQMHLPGSGVGGHCIPKDPWLLAYGARDKNIPVRLIPTARAINDSMPSHVFKLLQEALASIACQVSDSRVLIMGYSYMENTDDTRNSPSATLADRLRGSGAEVIIHDPLVPEYKGDLIQMAQTCDAAVVMVGHREYLQLDPVLLISALRRPILVDGRNVFGNVLSGQNGIVYRAVGRAGLNNR